jgi:REP element-mobilizing transposase RayT
MDRYWLLTWRTYGTWLPGDERGSITRVRDHTSVRIRHNALGTPTDGPMSGLERSSRASMKADAIYLTQDQAEAVLSQLLETAGYRQWHVLAAAVLSNHVHVVLGVLGDPDPDKLLGDLKAYGSRRLNRGWGHRASGTWWADKGSKRKLSDEPSVHAAVIYVATQAGAFAVYVAPEWAEAVQRARAAQANGAGAGPGNGLA